MIGERLQRARKAADLSLRNLAEQVGVSHTWINKFEKDQAMPDSKTLLKLGKVLGVRSEYFFRPEQVTLSQVEYRKKSTLPKKRLQAITHEILDHIERRMELEDLFPQPPVETFRLPAGLPDRVESYSQIEEVANHTRREWDLGMNPIPALIDLLEMKGIRVFCVDARNDAKFDGLFAYVADAPIVVVGKYWPGDRQRFTLAHELGHLILANRLSENLDLEKAGNRFAGALLFPDVSVKKYLGAKRSSLESREIQALKYEFGLSMFAIIRRAFDLEIIKESYYSNLAIHFRMKGWHKNEPGEQIKPENENIFSNLVFHALAEEYIGDSKAAELLSLSLDNFRRYRSMEEINAAPCQ
ncbi:helix-turn-helix domain-containing protein [Desulfomicrobium baculatum]|uniref:Helix-turn-helix domain protein n=2 Tax=Thermodesulfobacteriota TaxID=200940 RepID=C7LUL3_DESBD|nr:XRE family transcriptional regulator [Desulfomicrobium baculatum]ACU90928.1 helix-turn-helix domain protein [Desulfomicrobium baculatum DSM 4028]